MQAFPAAVFALCVVTSLACAFLLARSFARSRSKLLLWTALCFVGLAISNLFLFADVFLVPDLDLLPLRHLSTLAAIAVLIYGFVWEAE
jgi:hypothetical protein